MEMIDYGMYINEARASVHSHLKRGHQDVSFEAQVSVCMSMRCGDRYICLYSANLFDPEILASVHMSFEARSSVRMSFEASGTFISQLLKLKRRERVTTHRIPNLRNSVPHHQLNERGRIDHHTFLVPG